MARAMIVSLEGDILNDKDHYTFADVCRACKLSGDQVLELIDYGIIEPRGTTMRQWRFTGVSLQKVQRAYRLKRDLGLNTAGVALALDLLDEVHTLQQRLNRYEQSD
ncbi:MAG: MerR family transcriptional regulator [Planctomycetes bacterium]|nr:MerR family transcriptional regulator [Aestuariibacter sp.]MCP4236883.1 MerR family transcriptional regulator [Aestuariibacter sp.]MCP4609620.1 MerR family transcriptional regulator [Planctomycetota bacterium]|tara:strand:- start:1432 stop:1752 length:321 start_codon:yes stop_codon:yes gene_type:complete